MNYNIKETGNKDEENKFIRENFFIIDSDNLEQVNSHMYGYTITKDGILTDNYYRELGEYKKPEPQGVYIMIRKMENEIIINQDFHGSYGLYIYENKITKYFALSNSFILLEEYLTGKYNLTFNKDFGDNFIITYLLTYSLDETLINEIKQIPNDSFIVIKIKTRIIKIYNINYQENTIPLESKKGLNIIDNWIDKWGYIIRSLKNKGCNLSMDLSGGFDTRLLLSIFLNSGIDINDILVFSSTAKTHSHDIDLNIAKNISEKYGFKINNLKFFDDATNLNTKISLYNTIYSKLGFHKEFYLQKKIHNKSIFKFSGNGGEDLRGMPCLKIKDYINKQSSVNIKGHQKELFNSSINLLDRTVSNLKKKKKYDNEYEIAYDLYSKSLGKNHFGKGALERLITNTYTFQPLLDPEIKKIKYKLGKKSDDLIAYIYIRFAKDLINIPFQGNRTISLESIQKAYQLNNISNGYKIKTDYNKNFYVDNKTLSNLFSLNDREKSEDNYEYFKKFLKSPKYIKILNNNYDNNIYNWAKKESITSNFHPLRHHYALFAIAKILDDLSNKKGFEFNVNFINKKI